MTNHNQYKNSKTIICIYIYIYYFFYIYILFFLAYPFIDILHFFGFILTLSGFIYGARSNSGLDGETKTIRFASPGASNVVIRTEITGN